VQADGSEVTIIEGIATNGHLHPVQQGFGSRLVEAASKKLADDFFRQLSSEVAVEAVREPPT
jgi:carbon monoxide dehydrogenase subunit G